MVVLQFEDHAFPGRESSQSTKDASAQFTANQAALGAGAWAVVGHAVKHFFFLAVRRNGGGHIQTARILLSQMIETEISYDAVDPGVERALEAKARQVYVCPEKHFLINVLTILPRLAASEVLGRAQHGKQRAACTGAMGNLCGSCQALCTELGTVLVSALRDAVGIAQQCVARP